MFRKPGYRNPRANKKYGSVRREVLKRDRYKCCMPGCCEKKQLQIHHIVRWADSGHGRYNPSNLITLCVYHHEQVTGHEAIYAQIFMRIVEDNRKRAL